MVAVDMRFKEFYFSASHLRLTKGPDTSTDGQYTTSHSLLTSGVCKDCCQQERLRFTVFLLSQAQLWYSLL